ncbi:MAG: SH3 domain-containing protein, partial [Ruminiclostridium sp.]|nr:SH3 domain-containing protein [Ruminiclostridium sp.]
MSSGWMRTGDGNYMSVKIAVLCIISVIALAGCKAASLEAAVNNTSPEYQFAVNMSASGKVNGIPVNESTAVVTDIVADVFTEPDVRSRRITQVIYNQAVTVLEEDGGWTRIKAEDGSIGWVRSKFIDMDISSVNGRLYTHRIIVTGKEKSIFSDPTGGITVKEVVTGSVFYAFNNSDSAYEVYLPGNITGWLRGSGIIHVGLGAEVPITSGKDFAASAMKFKGVSYLLNGLSSMGMDSSGMIYI